MQKLLTPLVLLLAAGCVPSVISQNSSPPASQQTSPPQRAELMGGESFGYMDLSIGMVGLPGQNDIKPGTAVTITIPPMGIVCLAATVGLFWLYAEGGGGGGDPTPLFYPLAGFGEEDLMSQGITTGKQGPLQVTGVGWDGFMSFGYPEDLTFGGTIDCFTLGTGVRCISGLWNNAFWNALLGFQWTWMDFEHRPNALNYGVYGGLGLELMMGDNAGINATVRYAVMTGDMPQYDYWESTIGLAWYW